MRLGAIRRNGGTSVLKTIISLSLTLFLIIPCSGRTADALCVDYADFYHWECTTWTTAGR